MPRSTPDPPLRYDPFSRLYDTLIDIAEREEARRASHTAEESAAEDCAWDAERQQIIADAEHEQRTMLKVRREGDDSIHTLSRPELAARGFQPLFALPWHGRRQSQSPQWHLVSPEAYRIFAPYLGQ